MFFLSNQVNGKDMRNSTHQEAVAALIANVSLIKLLVRHDPPPKGLQVMKTIFMLFLTARRRNFLLSESCFCVM